MLLQIRAAVVCREPQGAPEEAIDSGTADGKKKGCKAIEKSNWPTVVNALQSFLPPYPSARFATAAPSMAWSRGNVIQHSCVLSRVTLARIPYMLHRFNSIQFSVLDHSDQYVTCDGM